MKLLILLLFVSQTSYSDSMSLGSIDVIAKTERSEDDRIDGGEVQASGASDLNGLFQKTPSVSAGAGTSSGQKVFMRGVEDINLNVQIDGARQGGYLFHHQGALFVEPEFIKSVDVRPGTARADDGFGALGGSLLIKTKNAFDFATPEHRHGGFGKGTYYSNERYLKPSLALYSLPAENFGVLLTGTYKDGNSYSDGDGETIRGTAEMQFSGLAKVSGRGETYSMDLSYEHFGDEGLRAPRQNFGWDSASDVLSRQESRRDTLTLNGAWSPDQVYGNLDGSVFQTKSQIRRERSGQSDSVADVESRGGSLSNTIDLSAFRFKFGSDYLSSSSASAAADEEEKNLGLFLQNQLKFFSLVKLDVGGRMDFHDFTAGGGEDFENEAFSPNARLEFCPPGGVCLFAGYSESFRGIRPAEALLITGTLNYAGGIEPETGITREVGGSLRRGPLSLKASFYKTDLLDLITLNRSTSTRDNTGHLRTQGYETSIGLELENEFNIRVSYLEVNPILNGAEISNQSFGVGTSLGDTTSLSVSKGFADQGLSFGAYLKLVERVSSAGVDKPSYETLDLWAEFTPKKLTDWRFGVYLANALDELYVDHATYLSTGTRDQLYSPGRDIRVSATHDF